LDELELREGRLTLDRGGVELREDRLTVEREGLELRLGVETLLLVVDRELTELLDGVRTVDLWVELGVEGLRTVLLEDVELREGAVVTRPLEEADEEDVEENFLTILLTALFFLVEVVDLVVVLERDGDLEGDEEKRFTTLLAFVLEVFPDRVLVEEDGNLLVTAERLGVERVSLRVEDLNLEGTIPFPWVTELLDVTDFCESVEYLLMAREAIPDFEEISPVLLTRVDGLLITPKFLRPESVVRIEVAFTREIELTVFPEE